MLFVRDLIHNEFDLNCQYIIYDCRNGKSWHEAEVLYKSETDKILDMHVKYVTISDNKLIIEVTDD